MSTPGKPAAFDQSISPYGVRIPFADTLGIRVIEAVKERVICAIDLKPEFSNSMGKLHGGALMTGLDVAMSCAVRAHYGSSGGVITIDMSVNFIRPSTGTITIEARVLNGGKSMAFCEAEAKDEGGKLLAKSIGTFRLMV
jgi:uncharacterized protein (TIGR00369 family)